MTDYYEWTQAEPRALARFVRPQDGVDAFRLPRYINRLDLLQAEGPVGLAGALYRTVSQRGLNYDLAPFDPRSGVVQKVRTPARILQEGRGTCLDLAVLFASLCLENDLLSLIVALEGHALAGVYRQRTRHDARRAAKALAWDRGVLTDRTILQELVDTDEVLLVECTGMARSHSLDTAQPEGQGREASGVLSFERACTAGAEQIARAATTPDVPGQKQRRYLYALDIHDLQARQGFEPVEDPEPPNTAPSKTSHAINVSQQGSGVLHITGDLVGRDKTSKRIGDDIRVGDISGTGVAVGAGARATVTGGASASDLAMLFAAAYRQIAQRPEDPNVDKDELRDAVQHLEKETAKGEEANENRLERWVKHLAGMAPDILDVMGAALGGPLSAAGMILKKVIERASAPPPA